MKYILFAVTCATLLGCSQTGLNSYLDNPRGILKDPHYQAYTEKVSALESQYLHKEIGYVEYQRTKAELDEQYEKEVQRRNAAIRGERPTF